MDDLAITKDAAEALREFVFTDKGVAARLEAIDKDSNDYGYTVARHVIRATLTVSVMAIAEDGGCISARYLQTDSGAGGVALGEVQI